MSHINTRPHHRIPLKTSPREHTPRHPPGRPGIYLEDIYVKPEFRRQGIGKSLFLAVNQIAAKRNCGRLDWTVLDWNNDAINFYQSLGARVLNNWRLVRLDKENITRLAIGTRTPSS